MRTPHEEFLRPTRTPMWLCVAITAIASACLVTEALAHHPTGGLTPTTWWEGLLSGLGHPIIGLDHLSFMIAIGIAAAYAPSGLGIVAAFAIASSIGVVGHVMLGASPFIEPVVAATVLLAGLALAFGRLGAGRTWTVSVALAGLAHGIALGESVVGAEPTPVLWYLAGLAVCQMAVATLAMIVVGMTLTNVPGNSLRVRIAGIVLGAIGAAFLGGAILQA